MLGIEAFARVYVGGGAAIDEGPEEIDRVRVAHRHDEQGRVIAGQAQFDVGDEREQRVGAMATDRALRVAGRARRVEKHAGIVERDIVRRLLVRAGLDQGLVALPTGRAAHGAEDDDALFGKAQLAADLLDHACELILHDDRRRAGIFENEGDFLADQTEVERDDDEAGLGTGGEYLEPLDAIVGEHGDPVAPPKPQTGEPVGEPAGALVPLRERHLPLEVARADPVGLQTVVNR